MKKALSLILALVMCLSLCACGEEKENTEPQSSTPETTTPTETEYQYSHLVNTEWKDVLSDSTMVLKEDGTGVRNGYAITWEVMGDFFFTTVVTNDFTTQYSLVFKDDIWRIVSQKGDAIFVGEDGYDYVFENEVPRATITDHQGNVVKYTVKELYQVYSGNKGLFDELYKGADITFVGVVKSVHTDFYSSGYHMDEIHFEEGWVLRLAHDQYKELLLTLQPGDSVQVSTQIYFVMGSSEIQVAGTYEDGGINDNSLRKTVIEVVTP